MTTLPGFTSAERPNRLGRYDIIRRLAAGGMAEIYLGRAGEIEGLKTPVVVKRILPHLAEDEQFIAMFLDEARLASQFHHPNVIRIIEVGKHLEEYFIVMELVQGEALSSVMRQLSKMGRVFRPQMAAHIIAQAAAGLHYAHTATDTNGNPLGVVHRDVSPQNLLVSFEGAVKVIDFGVARALNRITKTQAGGRKGKVGYLAPEQANGDTVDARTDVFALGIVFWEMVTGKRLFSFDTDLQTFKVLMDGKYPRPTEHQEIPAALEKIIMKALAFKASNRYESALEMQTEIESCLSRMADDKPVGPGNVARLMKDTLSEQYGTWRDLMRSAFDPDTTPIPVEIRPAKRTDVPSGTTKVTVMEKGVAAVAAVKRPDAPLGRLLGWGSGLWTKLDQRQQIGVILGVTVLAIAAITMWPQESGGRFVPVPTPPAHTIPTFEKLTSPPQPAPVPLQAPLIKPSPAVENTSRAPSKRVARPRKPAPASVAPSPAKPPRKTFKPNPF